MTYSGQTIAIVGMARSGLACADVLIRQGARVALYDDQPADHLCAAIQTANDLGVTPHVGGAFGSLRGVDRLVVSPSIRKNHPLIQQALEAHIPVLSEIEVAFQIAQAPIVAVTGTNGKTTTTLLLGAMLAAGGLETFTGGNVAAGEIAMPLVVAADRAPAHAVIAAEISSFQLEWIHSFRPCSAALLPITPDHADQQTWDEYVHAKWRLFENQAADDLAVLSTTHRDSPNLASLRGRVQWFGGPEVREQLRAFLDLDRIPLPGSHNLDNILCAAMLARSMGVADSAIASAVYGFPGVVHRLEWVATCDGVRYINNSMCTNVDAFEKSLRAIEEPKVVIMGGVFKGGDPAPLGTAILENNVRHTVVFGRSAGVLCDALTQAGVSNVHCSHDGIESVTQWAKQLAEPGDTVMLAPACASFDQFRNFEDRGNQFKAAVHRACSAERGAEPS